MVRRSYEESVEGVPQGGPLSPLLANIMLDELDKELARRGHKFVRYADDCMILVRSRRAAERVSVASVQQNAFVRASPLLSNHGFTLK